MKRISAVSLGMKSSREMTRTAVIAACVLASLLVLALFQNCAPALPLDGVVSANSASIRATATPGGGAPVGIGTGTTYSGPTYDGVCTWDSTIDQMAQAGTDVSGNLIAFNNTSTQKAAFWNIAPAGSIARASVCYLNLSGYKVEAIGDFDGDFNKDVLWTNDTTGDVIVWLMYGSNRKSTGLVANISSAYNIEGVADFNGDGKDDLLLRDGSNNIVVMQMNGLSSPTTVAVSQKPTSTQSITALSSYYDTTALKKKIAIFFYDSSATAGTAAARPVWYMNGTTATVGNLPTGFVAGSTTTNGVTTNFIYNILGIGDFNGDANADFVLQDPSTGNVRIRYSTYASGMFAVYGTDGTENTIPSTWTFTDVQKVNGDVFSDWLWTVNGGTLPVLEYSPVQGTQGNLVGLNYIQSGYSLFKYSHR